MKSASRGANRGGENAAQTEKKGSLLFKIRKQSPLRRSQSSREGLLAVARKGRVLQKGKKNGPKSPGLTGTKDV